MVAIFCCFADLLVLICYFEGAFSCVSMTVRFHRRINYYIMGLFVPSILIVLLSWVAFWIDKASTPGRVSLSLLTILTMTNQVCVIYSWHY